MPNWRGLIGAWLKPGATGARGERLAEAFLRRKRGYGIVARNWRSPRDRREEIDLVCCDGDVLVFVEVKARDAAALVPGYFAVDRRKKNVLRRACTAYLRSLREPPRTYRFDIVEVAFPSDGGEPEVNHFANIPLFSRFHRPR